MIYQKARVKYSPLPSGRPGKNWRACSGKHTARGCTPLEALQGLRNKMGLGHVVK